LRIDEKLSRQTGHLSDEDEGVLGLLFKEGRRHTGLEVGGESVVEGLTGESVKSMVVLGLVLRARPESNIAVASEGPKGGTMSSSSKLRINGWL